MIIEEVFCDWVFIKSLEGREDPNLMGFKPHLLVGKVEASGPEVENMKQGDTVLFFDDLGKTINLGAETYYLVQKENVTMKVKLEEGNKALEDEEGAQDE